MSCSLGWHSCKDETHNTRQKLMTPDAWVCSIAVTHQPQKHPKTPKGLDISDLLANCLQESADLQQPKLADSRDNKGRREVVSPSPTPGSLPWLPHGRAMTNMDLLWVQYPRISRQLPVGVFLFPSVFSCSSLQSTVLHTRSWNDSNVSTCPLWERLGVDSTPHFSQI